MNLNGMLSMIYEENVRLLKYGTFFDEVNQLWYLHLTEEVSPPMLAMKRLKIEQKGRI